MVAHHLLADRYSVAVDAEREMRLDELAAAADVATTTVRLYRQRGLLPPPRLVGRTGWYGPAHLARLRLIARLQDEGFSLAGIGKLLESWERGHDLTELIGVEEQLGQLLARRAPLTLDATELADRVPGTIVTPGLVQRAVALGLIELTDDGRFRVPDERFLDTGAALAELGVPAEVVLDEWADLVRHTDAIADRFISVFEQHLLPGGWREGLDAARARALATTLARLQHAAGQVVVAALDASLAAVGAQRLAELVPADAGDR
jgi:DNA-binding transcriptional MerR regulator